MNNRYIKNDKLLIAHYDGNIDNPLGLLHEDTGKPILLENEKKIAETHKVRCFIGKKQKNQILFGESAFDDAGYGSLYKTNLRLIYIREPQPLTHLAAHGVFGMPVQSARVIEAQKWKKHGWRECISIPLDKIMVCKKKGFLIKKVYLELTSDDFFYWAFFKPYRRVGDLFYDILKK